MLAAAILFFALGSASALWGLVNGGALSPLAHFIGFLSLTFSAILLVLGLPSTRRLIG